MDLFAQRLRLRARQLGVSNSEIARRAGLEERRYGHYVTGRREPDLATLIKIAQTLQTSPNWLLDVNESASDDEETNSLYERLRNLSLQMTKEQLALFILQGETITRDI